MFRKSKLLQASAIASAALLALSCSNVSYYKQAVEGHLSIMAARQPVSELLADPELSAKRREQLTRAQQIRDYASNSLGLPDNSSYKSYVELDRPFVVWNAVITPRYSLTPEKWCFPIAGCISYRGYYDESAARQFAEQYDDADFDRFVGGSRAYSTLGWFNDPLTSPMLDSGDILLAEVVFHELAHQQLYIKDDTAFNEAFASAVGEAGVLRWLQDQQPESLPRYQRYLERKAGFNQLLRRTSERLQKLYAEPRPRDDMEAGKQAVLQQLSDEYAELKAEWEGYDGYDGWFEKPVNNARLALVSVYRDLIPQFDRWLQHCDGELPRFYTTMAAFSGLSKSARLDKLRGPADCSP